MIVFQTPSWEWDLTDKGISFNEDSPYFTDKQTKNYSFPFNVNVGEDAAEKLGLITTNGVISYNQRIYGYLIVDHDFYDAYLNINDVEGKRVELTLFYGKETLKLFDKKLPTLPFPVVNASPDLPTFAKSQLSKSWPEATHNFVKVFRDQLSKDSNYKYFENFLNNYVDGGGGVYSFPVNTNETIEGEVTAVNRNVMVPMVYLIEVLRVGFKTEGLDIRGDFVDDEFNHKVVWVPKNFMEKFASTQYDSYSFSNYTIQNTVGSTTYNVYKKVHTPTNEGSFSFKINVNFSNALARYFKLTVIQNGITLFEAFSENTEVNINQTLDIAIVNTNVFHDILVEMTLLQQSDSIAAYNHFVYEYKEGSLNLFPTNYTLSDYIPNITFRALINELKRWLNLKFDYAEDAVYINYLEDSLANIIFFDKSHLEQPHPKRTLNTNNLFKLEYPNEETLLVNADGQTFNESDYVDSEITPIKMEVYPLSVKERFSEVTAIYPDKDNDFMFCLFRSGYFRNNAVKDVDGRSMGLQQIYLRHYKNWLRFRANSEALKDSFKIHYTEPLNITEGIFKYNKRCLAVSFKKKRISDEHYQVDAEYETF